MGRESPINAAFFTHGDHSWQDSHNSAGSRSSLIEAVLLVCTLVDIGASTFLRASR